MFRWILPIFLFSLIAPPPPGNTQPASDVEKPPSNQTIYYPIKESCDIPATWGPATSLHHKDSHAFYYFDKEDNAWKIKRARPFGNVTYGTWWY